MSSLPPISSLLDCSRCARVSIYPIAIVTLLSFSPIAWHDCATHFRLGGLGRVVARYTVVSPLHDQPRPRAIAAHLEPIAHSANPPLLLRDHFESDAATRPSLVTWFCRLKLGPHRECDADPAI